MPYNLEILKLKLKTGNWVTKMVNRKVEWLKPQRSTFWKNIKERGAVLINPDEPPFNTVKFQFGETYYRLDDEYTYRGMCQMSF